ELMCLLGIHQNTLCLYMRCHGIEHTYTEISDADLNNLVKEFKKRRLESGLRYIIGFMWAKGVHIQYHHVIQSLSRVDRLSQAL
ncbi:hypothetical protein F5J12DRAFT_721132, partial [Pisolithus orientalis]|uniref:uncharacterized protein n=1 Tax=Pisolithus orientalis TaxID=936130 RepID=UPI0022257F84